MNTPVAGFATPTDKAGTSLAVAVGLAAFALLWRFSDRLVDLFVG